MGARGAPRSYVGRDCLLWVFLDCSVCDSNAQCAILANGRANCTCRQSFVGDGRTCRGLSMGGVPPSFLETMKSLCSSFVCCYDSANRFVSLYLDVNECLSGLDNCDPYANCVDTQPGFQCSCPFPYVGNGTHCDGGNIKIQGNKVIFTLICVLI